MTPSEDKPATTADVIELCRQRHIERWAARKAANPDWREQRDRLMRPETYVPPAPPPLKPLSQTWCERFILTLGDGEFRSAVRHCLEVT